MNRLISIFIITITMHGVCHAQSLKAELYDNIKQQVQSGVFNRLTDEELTNVKCEAMIIGATVGDIQKISPALIQWTTTESQWVADEVLKILESDNRVIGYAKISNTSIPVIRLIIISIPDSLLCIGTGIKPHLIVVIKATINQGSQFQSIRSQKDIEAVVLSVSQHLIPYT